MIGPGKYDEVCTQVREDTNALGVVLLIFGGCKGNGFSCQAPFEFTATIPSLLRQMADQIEADCLTVPKKP